MASGARFSWPKLCILHSQKALPPCWEGLQGHKASSLLHLTTPCWLTVSATSAPRAMSSSTAGQRMSGVNIAQGMLAEAAAHTYRACS